MLSRESMAEGMAALGAAFNRQITPLVVQIFHGVVGPKLSEKQWEHAVRRALEVEQYFPPPAVLLRYGRAEGLPQARAAEVYDQIVSAFEAGRPLGPREVSEDYGTAAMEAFCAAGGTRAFSWCELRDEPFRRKAFIEGWVEVAEQDPAFALPAGGEPVAALPEPQAEPGPSKAEAATILTQISWRAGY